MKGNKKLYLSFGIGGIIILCGGMVLLALGIIDDPLLSEKAVILLKVFGSCSAVFGLILSMIGGIYFFKSKKELIVEENDERNIAIRGKAAQLTCLITVILLFIVVIVCLALEIFIAAFLVAGVMLTHSMLQMILIGYFHKKM